jgi:alpha-beta hydrolase superfamily lysophospholipase
MAMTKKIILFAVLMIVAFHIGWYLTSRTIMHKKLPSEAVIQDTLNNYMKTMKISIDGSSLTETSLDANGIKLHLDIFSVGKNAPTVVFIPGTSAYTKFYIELMYKMYLQGFNVVGFDPRGHGLSSGLRGDYTINEIVDDTLAVVKYARERFGSKVAIVGSSQGGIVAFYAAARDNSIAAAVCHNFADLNGKDNLVLSQIRPPQFMVPIAEFMTNLYKSYSIPISLYLDLSKEKAKDGSDAASLINKNPIAVKWITFRALGSLMHTDLAQPVDKITVPVMLIQAEKDTIFPSDYVENIFNRLTCKKKYLFFKNTQHLVMTNNVDEVVPPIAAWLKEVM